MSYGDEARRRPGILSNPQFGLLLQFMLNPEQMDIVKDPNYTERAVPGWRAPQKWWTSGGQKVITFSTFWDKTDARNTGGVNLFTPPTPGVGLRDVIAVIESFLEPKNPTEDVSLKDLPSAVKNLISLPSAFLPPPAAFFIYGTRIWKTRLVSAPISEIKHDRFLNPTQIEVAFRLEVIEEGVFNKILTKERAGLALVASAQAGVDLIPEIIGDIGRLAATEGVPIPSSAALGIPG